MYLSGESIIIILLVGLIAGWLAGKIVQGTGYGLLGDIVIGIIGAFIASWLFPRLGIALGAGIVREIIDATIGAILLLVSCGWCGAAGAGRREFPEAARHAHFPLPLWERVARVER